MRPDLTKSQRRRIRELAGTAYDRDLSRELGNLEHDFALWRRGEIDAHDYSAIVFTAFTRGRTEGSSPSTLGALLRWL